MPEYKIVIGWSKEAGEILQEKGLKGLKKTKNQDACWEEKEFNTQAERAAYCQGMTDANGWDDPTTLLVNWIPKGANPLYIGTKVHIGIYRKRYVVIDDKSGQMWANEYFKTLDDVYGFIKVNELVLTKMEINNWKPKED